MKKIRLPPSAINELSPDQFIRACVAFQQAKTVLSQHLNGADAASCDAVSLAVYNLANKALTRHQRNHAKTVNAVKKGERLSFPEAIAKAVKGKKRFDSRAVIDAMKKRGTLPKSENVRAYVNATLAARKDLFKRVEQGVYRLKTPRKLVFEKKPPKQLPARTE